MRHDEDDLDFDSLSVDAAAADTVYGNTEQVRREYSQGINPVTTPRIAMVRMLHDSIENQGRLINERGMYLSWLSAAIRAVPPDDETAQLIGRTLDNLYI
jgi:hypothetical protein